MIPGRLFSLFTAAQPTGGTVIWGRRAAEGKQKQGWMLARSGCA